MRTVACHSLAIALLSSMLIGCESAYYGAMEKVGYHKREILVDRIEDTRDSQAGAQQQFRDALEQFRTSLDIEERNAVALANVEEIEYWLMLDSEEQRLDYCLIPLAEELRRLDRAIDGLNRDPASPASAVRLRQLRERAAHIGPEEAR